MDFTTKLSVCYSSSHYYIVKSQMGTKIILATFQSKHDLYNIFIKMVNI